ncbi:MAG: hypothetical protein ACYTAO_09000 [Planctomycetota bacterium]
MRRLLLIPARDALPAALDHTKVMEGLSAREVRGLLALYTAQSRLLLRYALAIGGTPSEN